MPAIIIDFILGLVIIFVLVVFIRDRMEDDDFFNP